MNIKKPDSTQPIPQNAQKVFQGVLFDVYQWEQELFDGSFQTYEKLKRPDTVLIIPVIPEGNIIMLDEEQPGKVPFTSVPGGKIDKNEEPLEAAKRELMEETGFEANNYIFWFAIQPISKIDWTIYVYIAKGCKKANQPRLEAGEKINIKMVTLDQFMNQTLQENFRDQEIKMKVMEAKIYPEKMAELKELLK